jgi:hypothetical protein
LRSDLGNFHDCVAVSQRRAIPQRVKATYGI